MLCKRSQLMPIRPRKKPARNPVCLDRLSAGAAPCRTFSYNRYKHKRETPQRSQAPGWCVVLITRYSAVHLAALAQAGRRETVVM